MPTLGDTAQTDPVDLSEPAGAPYPVWLRVAAAPCRLAELERAVRWVSCREDLSARLHQLHAGDAVVAEHCCARREVAESQTPDLAIRIVAPSHTQADGSTQQRGNLRFAERSTRFLPKRGKTGSFSGRLELSSPPSRARERALPVIARAPSPQLPKHKKPQVRGPPAAPGPGPGERARQAGSGLNLGQAFGAPPPPGPVYKSTSRTMGVCRGQAEDAPGAGRLNFKLTVPT